MILQTFTFIDETNIYAPLHITHIIFKLNNLQAISFQNFITNKTKNKLLQYVGRVASIGKHK
jgi:hypothetical protein